MDKIALPAMWAKVDGLTVVPCDHLTPAAKPIAAIRVYGSASVRGRGFHFEYDVDLLHSGPGAGKRELHLGHAEKWVTVRECLYLTESLRRWMDRRFGTSFAWPTSRWLSDYGFEQRNKEFVSTLEEPLPIDRHVPV